MRIIIVGGGTLAYFLIKTLQQHRHEIFVIDMQRDVCEKIANDFDEVQVYYGDGTSIKMLEEIEAKGADFYIAVTGQDENNLVGCQIAKNYFRVKMTVARVNNPKNTEMFYRLGVDKIYSSTQILADIIEQEIDLIGLRVALNVENTSKQIVEFKLSPRSAACDKSLQENRFPGSSRVVLISREDGSVIMPQGDVYLRAGDTLLMVCDEKEIEAIWKTMVKE